MQMSGQELIQIGEFAKLAGTNLRTLRYYEELGLLEPARRSEGGFRYYTRSQLERMAAIKRLQDLGLSLKEIASIIVSDGPVTGDELVARLRSALEKQIDVIERKMASLRKDLEQLHGARERLVEVCQDCGTPFSAEACDPCPRDGMPLPAMIRALL